MASVSLIVIGKSLDPTMVTRLLKLQPSQQWKKGERKSYRRKDGTVRIFNSKHKLGGWKRWPSDRQRKMELSLQVKRWLMLLTRKKKQLEEIQALGCDIFLDCCIIGEADCVSLSPATIGRMAELGLHFEATFYSSSDKEPNQGVQ